MDGASTPTHIEPGTISQTPPFGLQTPVRLQLKKPVPKLLMLHASPRAPMRMMSPLGWFTVTSHGEVPIVAVPPGHWASLPMLPFELVIVNVMGMAVH